MHLLVSDSPDFDHLVEGSCHNDRLVGHRDVLDPLDVGLVGGEIAHLFHVALFQQRLLNIFPVSVVVFFIRVVGIVFLAALFFKCELPMRIPFGVLHRWYDFWKLLVKLTEVLNSYTSNFVGKEEQEYSLLGLDVRVDSCQGHLTRQVMVVPPPDYALSSVRPRGSYPNHNNSVDI